MIVIEMTEDKFGQAMKDITCIEEKLEKVKHVFEEESSGMSYRGKRYMDDDKDYSREYSREYDKEREYPRDRQSYRGRYM